MIFADFVSVSMLRDQRYLTHNLTSAFCCCCCFSPDHHFDRIHSDAQPLVIRDDERHAATAVGHLCVVVHPLSWRGLRHDMQVHLFKNILHWTQNATTCAVQSMRQLACVWRCRAPSPQPKWPCPEGRTWSDLSGPAAGPPWTQRRWHGGLRSHSAKEGWRKVEREN